MFMVNRKIFLKPGHDHECEQKDWQLVMLILTLTLTLVYFLLDHFIWNEELPTHLLAKTPDQSQKTTLFQDYKKYKALQLNSWILSLLWLTLGSYNYYGTMNCWKALSLEHGQNLIFAYNLLATVLDILSKLCVVAICLIVARSNLPLGVLQVCSSIAIFLMFSLKNDDTWLQILENSSLTFTTHMTTFLKTASFSLTWVITATMFPKSYR